MELQLNSTLVELGQKQFTILSLFQKIKVYVCKSDKGYLTIYGDIHGLEVIAYCFVYSALNPNHILFLSLRKNGLTSYLEERDGKQAARDLVILHHRLHLNHKDWKAIRALLQRNKTTEFFVNTDELTPERLDLKPFRTYYYHGNKDVLNVRDYLHTLFFVGSREVFGSIANDCKSLSLSEPVRFFKEFPGYHIHTHMDMYLGNQEWSFAVDIYDEALWGW